MRMTLCAAHHRPAFRTFFDDSMSLPGVEEAQCPWSWRLWLWLEAPALACGDVAALMAGSEVAAAVGVVVVECQGSAGWMGWPHRTHIACRRRRGVRGGLGVSGATSRSRGPWLSRWAGDVLRRILGRLSWVGVVVSCSRVVVSCSSPVPFAGGFVVCAVVSACDDAVQRAEPFSPRCGGITARTQSRPRRTHQREEHSDVRE
jgi:hypothetical protein